MTSRILLACALALAGGSSVLILEKADQGSSSHKDIVLATEAEPEMVLFGTGDPVRDPCTVAIPREAAEEMIEIGIEEWVRACQAAVAEGRAVPSELPPR